MSKKTLDLGEFSGTAYKGVDWIQVTKQGPVTGFEHSIEPSSSIRGEKFLGQLSDYQLDKKDSAQRSYNDIRKPA
jgi:hypothetical protein